MLKNDNSHTFQALLGHFTAEMLTNNEASFENSTRHPWKTRHPWRFALRQGTGSFNCWGFLSAAEAGVWLGAGRPLGAG